MPGRARDRHVCLSPGTRLGDQMLGAQASKLEQVMHRHEQLARREIELIQAGDDEGVIALYASDFVLHYPGRNPLAGTYTDVGQFLDRLGELFEGGTVQRELHDALGTDDHAVQLLRVTAEAKGRSHTWNAVIVMHVRDGQFAEAWFHVSDQYALDEYLTSLAED